ncbi:MoxR-like ATPase [Lachnospiraceae bacterium NE2001]|nr:MoxR-like ATPase [Lachnospiraceae bacterium NE2001]
MEVSEIRGLYSKVLENMRTVMIGSEEVFSLVFSAMLSGGHVLLEDMPGTGKTTMAKCIADSIDAEFRRVQFTPDLMPQDITGLNIFSQKSNEFEFIPGPVFTNILLADEINRATPRTQSALLEAMEERVVTVDGESRKLSAPFIVIATENPVETTGTFPLPEAQLDRFMVKLTMGDLSIDNEVEILQRFVVDSPQNEVKAVCSGQDIVNACEAVKQVKVAKVVMEYIVGISDASRNSSKLFSGVSPRASLNLMRMSQAFAAISGRDFVTPDDVRFLAPYVYSHRVMTGAGAVRLKDVRDIITEVASTVAVPTEDWKK